MENTQVQNNPTMEDQVKGFDPTQSLTNFFENFIKQSSIVKEREVVKGITVKLKVLDTGELLAAESILSLTNPGIPFDVVQKVRAASILSQSIIAINGLDVEIDATTSEAKRQKRNALYTNLLRMPALVIQKMYELYIEAVKEQNELYSKDGDLVGKIENF